MTSNKFTQSLLVVIALLLTWLAIRPYLLTPTAVEASVPMKYKVANLLAGGQSSGAVEQQLNLLGSDGWVLVQCVGLDYCVLKR
jgi:hypothetical protein